MISNQVCFKLYERQNTFRRSGKEWALTVRLVGQRVNFPAPWTIKTWEKKPSDTTVADVKKIVMRSFEFYHNQLRIPPFDMTVVEV